MDRPRYYAAKMVSAGRGTLTFKLPSDFEEIVDWERGDNLVHDLVEEPEKGIEYIRLRPLPENEEIGHRKTKKIPELGNGKYISFPQALRATETGGSGLYLTKGDQVTVELDPITNEGRVYLTEDYKHRRKQLDAQGRSPQPMVPGIFFLLGKVTGLLQWGKSEQNSGKPSDDKITFYQDVPEEVYNQMPTENLPSPGRRDVVFEREDDS